MTIVVRRARADELDAVGELTALAYRVDELLPSGSDYDERLRDARHRAANAELLVAVDEQTSTILGTVTLATAGTEYAELAQPGEAEFRMLAVAPEARRHGVAHRLVQACLDRARTDGARAMVICSSTDMPGAHRIYAGFGFGRLPERDWSPVEGVQLLAFTLDLTANPAAG